MELDSYEYDGGGGRGGGGGGGLSISKGFSGGVLVLCIIWCIQGGFKEFYV